MKRIISIIVAIIYSSVSPLASLADDTTSLGSAVESLGENVGGVTEQGQSAEGVSGDTVEVTGQATEGAADSDDDAIETTVLDPLEGE